VWLDRGELDKIIERSTAEMAPPQQPFTKHAYAPHPQHYGHRQRRKSFLEKLFD
jgi:Zn-finger nucleic acid-binding protein